jgi:type I restriction-modification system DNA methylase subunit
VLRRLDCVLAGTKEKVLGKQAELRGKNNPTMGTIFEELLRKFNEALDENPGSTSRRGTSST